MLTCDDERIALYINGDLDESEQIDLEAHLAACMACRTLAGALRADSKAISDAVESAQVPASVTRTSTIRGRVRHQPFFSPAVAAAVLAALLIGITTGPAIADGVAKLWRGLVIREVRVDDYRTEVEKLTAGAEEARQETLLNTFDLAEAEKAAGFKLMTPKPLPDGFKPYMIRVEEITTTTDTWRDVQQTFGCYATCEPDQKFYMSQMQLKPASGNQQSDKIILRPEGSYRVVEIAGAEGLVTDWKGVVGGITLQFVKDGKAIWMRSDTMSEDQLIQVARALH